MGGSAVELTERSDGTYALALSLGGGGSASLKTDAQGKTHGLAVLRLEMDIPQSVLDATPAD